MKNQFLYIAVFLACISCTNNSSVRTLNLKISCEQTPISESFERGVKVAISQVNGESNMQFNLAAGKTAVDLEISCQNNPSSSDVPSVSLAPVNYYKAPTQGESMAIFAAKDLKLKRVAILREKASEESIDMTKTFVETFRKLGGRVVAVESYQKGDIDFQEQLVFIRARNPEAIYVPGMYKEAALVARQVKKLGLKTQLLGSNGWDSPKLFELGLDSVNGAYYTSHFSSHTKDPKVKKWVKEYRKTFSGNPDANTALAYETTTKVLNTLKSIKGELSNAVISNKISGMEKISSKSSLILQVDGPTQK